MTAVEYDSPRDDSARKTAHFQHDGDDGRALSTAIVSTVATVTRTDPAELETLYDRIDPDALDALFESTANGDGRDDGHVRFPFAGCEITVYGDGFTVVRRIG